MAMTDDDDLDGVDDLLARAAGTLREHTDAGWVQARASLVAKIRSAVRPSAPVRARHAAGTFFVSGSVLTAVVRHAIEGRTRARPHRITLDTDDDHALTEVTVHVGAAFGEALLPLADEVRRVVVAQLRDTLGAPTLPASLVRVDLVVVDVFRA